MTGAEFRKIRVDQLAFTVAEAAVMFGCDERTVKRWQADEVRIPGSVALALTALLFINENEMALPLMSLWRDIVPGLPVGSDRRFLSPDQLRARRKGMLISTPEKNDSRS